MIYVLWWMLSFSALYHIFVTVFAYWWLGAEYQQYFSLIRDFLWIGVFVLTLLFSRKHLHSYIKTWKWVWISLWVLLLFSIGISYFLGTSLNSMFIGIKYGFWYLIILFTTTLLWFVGKDTLPKKLLFFLRILLTAIVVGWFLWQWAKLLCPDRFMHIGYGPLNDFFYGKNPPLYYLTWLGWTLRRQGIFSWPNNYWYFLVLFFPLLLLRWKQAKNYIKGLFSSPKQIFRTAIFIVWIVALLLTLSRTALIWAWVAFACMHIKRIKQHKTITWVLALILIWGVVWLSLLKGTSTLGHIAANFWSVQYVIQHPLWQWLGTSWPAIHHNGTILPENYFLQIMIDIGTLWFLFWVGVMLVFISIGKKIIAYHKHREASQEIYTTRYALLIWFFSLLIMWMFLHVFEDSMVNYLFFIPLGIFTWYLSKKI